MERRNVGMLKAGVYFDFAKEAFGKIGILIQVRKYDFHGLLAVGEQTAYAEHLAHPAAPQDARNPIITEDIADLNGHSFDCNADGIWRRRPGPAFGAIGLRSTGGGRAVFVIEWLHMDTIGLIGVGLLGSAIAARLTAAGYTLFGYDIIPERRLGAASAQEVARRCRTIILSLPTSDVVVQVLGGMELSPSTTIVDTTTGEPDTLAAIGAKLAKAGVDYLDATVLGSSRVVRNGTATVMAGGRRQAFDAAAPLFRTFSSRAFYLGSFGSGARMKLVANLALGLHRAVLAEALSFAGACGVSPSDALEVLKAGAAYSRVMDDKGEKMLHHDFTVEARLSQHLKDVRLILAAATAKNARTPLSLVHRQLLERLEAAGYGDVDNSAIIMAYE